MYALGATLVELSTGVMPFHDLTNQQVMIRLVQNKITLADYFPAPGSYPPEWQAYYDLVKEFVRFDPAQRPSATQAIERLLTAYPWASPTFVVRASKSVPLPV
jgi:serine/threonine protein kinase